MRNESPPWVTRFHERLSKPIPGETWEALKRGEIGWGKTLAQGEKRSTLGEDMKSWRRYVKEKEGEGVTSLDRAKVSWAKYYAEEEREERERQEELMANGEAIPVEVGRVLLQVMSE